MNKSYKILIDTVGGHKGVTINSIYHLDAQVDIHATARKPLVIRMPSDDVLDQINRLRPNYMISYLVA